MRGLILTGLTGLVLVGTAQAGSWQFATEAVWHDNATNAERSLDLLPGLQWRSEFQKGTQRALPGGHRLRAAAGVRAEIWPRFQGLNLAAPGLATAWEFKSGLGPHWPVFEAGLAGEWVGAQERARGGWGMAGHLQVRQRVGPGWLISAGHEWRRFDARGRAFDRTGREWLGRAEWTPAADWIVAVEVRRRVGDVVSYSRPPRPDLVALGKPVTLVDTFEQGVPWIAYYFQAETRSGSLEVQRVFGHTRVGLQHAYRHTLHNGPGYRNHLTTLRLIKSF